MKMKIMTTGGNIVYVSVNLVLVYTIILIYFYIK